MTLQFTKEKTVTEFNVGDKVQMAGMFGVIKAFLKSQKTGKIYTQIAWLKDCRKEYPWTIETLCFEHGEYYHGILEHATDLEFDAARYRLLAEALKQLVKRFYKMEHIND